VAIASVDTLPWRTSRSTPRRSTKKWAGIAQVLHIQLSHFAQVEAALYK
jgi:hypothetical protein